MSLFINPVQFQNDSAGRAAAFSSYDFYETETYTRKTTYADIGLTVENPNPVIADKAGRFPAIYLADGDSYRVVFSERKEVGIYSEIWTEDDVQGGSTGQAGTYNVGTGAGEIPTNADSGAGSVGPVSQVEGVPTGRIIESYTASETYVVKYADGTMLMTYKSGLNQISAGFAAEELWFFPELFIADPVVLVSGAADSIADSSAIVGYHQSLDSNSTTLRGYYIAASGTVIMTISATAIGRWF